MGVPTVSNEITPTYRPVAGTGQNITAGASSAEGTAIVSGRRFLRICAINGTARYAIGPAGGPALTCAATDAALLQGVVDIIDIPVNSAGSPVRIAFRRDATATADVTVSVIECVIEGAINTN